MRFLLLLASFAITLSSFSQDTTAWLEKNATLILHDAFEREEDGNLAKAIGNGWNSATADRVPDVKMADLDGGILKVASASEAATSLPLAPSNITRCAKPPEPSLTNTTMG